MILQNSTDVKTEIFYDENKDPALVDVRYEKHIVNPNGLIQLQNIPSPLHTVFDIRGKDGVTVIKYNKVEVISNKYDFTVDYINGILTFHNSQKGKEVQISYTNSIGRLSISADRIFTGIDNQGNITQTLGTLLEEGRQTLSDLEVLGGATKVITEIEGYIESIKQLTGNIIEGENVNTELKKSTDTAKSTNTTLNSTINNANNQIDEMNSWVESHSDIVNLDNRVDTAEIKIDTTITQLAESPKLGYLNTPYFNWRERFESYRIDILDIIGNKNTNIDITSYLQNIINNYKSTNNCIYFPSGHYYINELVINEKHNLKFEGTSKYETIIEFTDGINKLIEFKGCQFITFKNLTIIINDNSNESKIIFTEGENKKFNSNLRFINCKFVNNSTNSRSTIKFIRNCYNINFKRCEFEETYTSLLFDNNGYDVSAGDILIEKCIFKNKNGQRAKRCVHVMGRGSRAGTYFYFVDNKVTGYDEHVNEIYHIQGYYIVGNEINDCKSLIENSYEGIDAVEKALFWLDTSENPSKNNIFENNSIYNCVGNIIYAEEVNSGSIVNNKFYNITKRPNGIVTYKTDDTTITSYGTHCIVLVGGVANMTIKNNKFIDVESTLLVCRKFCHSIIGNYYVQYINFEENFVRCRENAINLKERINKINIKNNTAYGTANYSFCEYEKVNTQDLDLMLIDNNYLVEFKSAFKRLSNGGSGIVKDNFLINTAGGSFFECENRESYIINNNIFATRLNARSFTIINS